MLLLVELSQVPKVVLEGKQNLRPGVPVKERTDEGKEEKSGAKGSKKDGSAPVTSPEVTTPPASAPSATASAASAS